MCPLSLLLKHLPADVTFSKEDKVTSLEILWHGADKNSPKERQVIEMFSIVTVLLRTTETPLKIEAVLLRPSQFREQ